MWPSTSAFRRSSKNRSTPPPRSTSPAAILTETLRKNPFRPSRDVNPLDEEDAEVRALNKDLHILAEVFADVQIEVLRELLKRFDGDSRLPISTEQLYKYKIEWARGRLQVPSRDFGQGVPLEEQFRSTNYISATHKALALEFRSSTKGAISAVLAEGNNSYTKARPILQEIASRSRWTYFANVLSWRKKKPAEDIPTVLCEKSSTNLASPKLLPTGSIELDAEFQLLFLRPQRRQSSHEQEAADLVVAKILNEGEAEAASALFECQVCYNDVPFENISTCTSEAHVVCLECVKKTLLEAVFGQGWAKSVAIATGSLRCLAPVDHDCHGHIPRHLVQRAILEDKTGAQTMAKFDDRLADEALRKSSLPIIRCPFCSYAEADTPPSAATARSLSWRLRKPNISSLILVLVIELIPAIIFCLLPLILFFPSYLTTLFYTSLSRLSHRHRTTRFHCLNAPCMRKSCLTCSKPWHDPHICHEPLILSLRTTVEAARTAAVKRTCPRCGTSFVKSSGCNKLTCTCGYAMCYLCRQNIGKAGDQEGAEGYRHFCEHFRPTAGARCTECDKCDLYKSEDEDEAVRRAGEEAEKLWRVKEGMVGVKGLEGAVGGIGGEDAWFTKVMRGEAGVQELVDIGVEMFVKLEGR